VVGDLHIGKELKLAASGIKIYDNTERMADRIIALAKLHKATNIILLGDVKDSIIRPDSVEMRIIQAFFKKLSSYTVFLVQGNHDAGLGEIPNVTKAKELRIGNVGLIHGNSLPSEDLMRCDYIIAGHDHPAAMIGPNLEKVWVVLDLKPRVAAKEYPDRNAKARLILMPAFNDLITGTDIGRGRILNPLVRRGLFDLKKAKLYTTGGDLTKIKLNSS
jgi:putative SbcD/Mre11-related phosphoesterase